MAANMQKKVEASFVVRNSEKWRYKNGASSLQLDPVHNRLFAGGRDGIIRAWNTVTGIEDKCMKKIGHHTNWVNDMVLCGENTLLISGSSDSTVKLWNVSNGTCTTTLRTHKFYVNALAYSKDIELVASAGQDRAIFLWDIETLTALRCTNNVSMPLPLIGNKEVTFSLAMNSRGTVLISGSAEKELRAWDPRNSSQLMKLRGCGNKNIMSLVLSQDGAQCVAGDSDGTINLWSLGQQRCVISKKVHSAAIWSLLATENFTHVISGGLDKQIVITDLCNPDNFMVMCTETAPILKICFTADQQGFWVSTLESGIRCWKLQTTTKNYTPPKNTGKNNEYDDDDNPNTNIELRPVIYINGGPLVNHYTNLQYN